MCCGWRQRLLMVATAAAAAAPLAGAAGGAGGDVDLSGLKGALESGGAQALLKTIQAMRASHQNNEAAMHIKKDSDGEAMYDFRDMEPTTPPVMRIQRKPALQPPVSAAGIPGAQMPQLAGAGGMPPLPNIPGMPQLPGVGGMPQVPGVGGMPQLTSIGGMQRLPGAAAPGMAGLTVWGARPPAPLPAVSTLASGSAEAPQSAGGVGSGELLALASGLEAVKANVELLTSEAEAAAHGQTVTAAAGLPQTQAQAASEIPHLQGDLKALVSRMDALEKENRKMHEELDTQAKRLKAVESAERAEEQEVNRTRAADAELHATVAKLMQRRKHLVVKRSRKAGHIRGSQGGPHASARPKTVFHNKEKAADDA